MTDNDLFERQLALGWRALSPPKGLEERVRARVRMPVSRWQALRASGALGVGAGALLVGLGFGAGYWLRPPRVVEMPASDVLHPAPMTMEMQVVAEVGAADEEREPPREPAPPSKPVTAPKRRGSQGLTRSGADGGELALIERAERALRARNPEVALALSGELAERFPQSALHEERRAILLMARCQAGASGTAAEHEQFARRYPGSVYTERIASECQHAQPTSP